MIKREMEDYVRQRHIEEGFQYVGTPHITKEGLFQTSGHLPYYADTMFPPMEMEGSDYYLKAMNCPMHNLIYRSRGRSYRELPLRLFEFGSVYRYEKSGVVHGLTRVRGLTQDDSHSYVHRRAGAGRDQAPAALRPRPARGLRARRLLPRAVHPRRPTSDKFIGSDEEWAVATAVLEEVADRDRASSWCPTRAARRSTARRSRCRRATRSAAPGRCRPSSTTSTSRRGFGLEYQAADGTRQQPVMIHSAKFGSIERFIGVLIEHYAGAFPPWLAPVQVVGIPVADEHVDYLRRRRRRSCAARGIRVEVDDSDDRMQKKIRNAQQQKVPFMLIAGDDDVAERRGVVPLPRRHAGQRRRRSTRRSREIVAARSRDRVQV